jgi:hypothetical protein
MIKHIKTNKNNNKHEETAQLNIELLLSEKASHPTPTNCKNGFNSSKHIKPL